MVRRRRIALAASALALAGTLAAGLFAWTRGQEGSGANAPVERVILITCDTLRADRLGVYDVKRFTSPSLERFARECVVFDAAYSSAPLTSPALATLMTGRLPDELGMHSNLVLLPEAATTLAETISAAGIPTAAVVSNWVLRKREGKPNAGFEQGFAFYDDRMEDAEKNRSNVKERTAAKTTDAAIEWLESRPGERFFLWVHYQDPHGPYTPPEEVVGLFERPLGDEPLLEVGTTQVGLGEIPKYQALGDARHPEYYRIRYDAEIRYFDRELGRLLDYLRNEELFENALVVFTADHGESLGEHGYWFSHGQNLYRELMHVPLLVRYPDRADDRPVNRSLPVGHFDLRATILDVLGLRGPAAHGQSLLSNPYQTLGAIVPHTLRAPGAEGRWEGATDGHFRLVVGPLGRRLFDLTRDPTETQDFAASERPRLRSLELALEEFQNRLPPLPGIGEPEELDPADLEHLDDLGYGGEKNGR